MPRLEQAPTDTPAPLPLATWVPATPPANLGSSPPSNWEWALLPGGATVPATMPGGAQVMLPALMLIHKPSASPSPPSSAPSSAPNSAPPALTHAAADSPSLLPLPPAFALRAASMSPFNPSAPSSGAATPTHPVRGNRYAPPRGSLSSSHGAMPWLSPAAVAAPSAAPRPPPSGSVVRGNRYASPCTPPQTLPAPSPYNTPLMHQAVAAQGGPGRLPGPARDERSSQGPAPGPEQAQAPAAAASGPPVEPSAGQAAGAPRAAAGGGSSSTGLLTPRTHARLVSRALMFSHPVELRASDDEVSTAFGGPDAGAEVDEL